MKKNIFLVATGRTGSSWLENCFEKCLGYNVVRISTSELRGNRRFEYMVDLTLEQRVEILNDQDEPWICKLIVDDWDHISLRQIADSYDSQLIWVWREDIVDLFLSYAAGVMTYVFNTSDVQGDYKTPEKIVLKDWQLKEFKRMIEIRDKHWDYYSHLFTHVVEYSTMFDSNPWGFKREDALGKLNKYTDDHREQARAYLKDLGLL